MNRHQLCTIFPRMFGAEFDALVADVRANGQRVPIVIHDGMILDGDNRYRACIEAGIEPKTVVFDGGDIVAYVLSANLHRRHIKEGQAAAIVANAQAWSNAQMVGRPKKEIPQDCGISTAADRAAKSGASLRTQQAADKVAKSDPELSKQVGHGEISLPKAIERITGKRQGTKEATSKHATQDGSSELDDMHGKIQLLTDSLHAQNEEIISLKDRLSAVGPTTEDQASAIETISVLRKELKTAHLTVNAITQSRDQYMSENGQLKRQIAMMQKAAKKAAP